MNVSTRFHLYFLATFKGMIGVYFLLCMLSGVALGQDAATPAKPVVEEKNDAVQAVVLAKLNSIIIPVIDFEDVSLAEAVDFLGNCSRDFDLAEKNPANKGISFLTRTPEADSEVKQNEQGLAVEGKGLVISELQLRNVSVLSALKYTCLLTDLKLSIEDKIVISPKKEGDKELAIPVDQAAKAALQNKLNTVMIPKIDFENVSIDEAIEYLRVRFTELDPDKKHLNLVLVAPPKERIVAKMQLKNVSVATYLKQICEATNLDYTVDDTAVILTSKKQ